MHIYVTSNRQKVEILMFYILRRGWGTANYSTLSSQLAEIEPRREKTGFLHMRKQRRRGNRKADQRLCFHYTDSKIPLLSKSEISSFNHLLWLYSLVCIGPGRKHQRPVFSQRGSIKTHPSFTMSVLVTWKGPIQNNRDKVETPFSLFYGDIFYLRKGS